jgi:hypothetical protein
VFQKEDIMSGKKKLIVDTLERAVWTWIETFLGLLLVAQVWTSTQSGQVLSILDAAQVAAVAAVPSALAVLKGLAASLIGDRDSASTVPSVSADESAH